MSAGPTRPLSITVEAAPSLVDQRVITDGLRAFNVAHIGDPGELPVTVFLRNEEGAVVGGVIGFIKWKWLYIDKLWIHDDERGSGGGRRLMEAAEEFARNHGATNVSLDTFAYQARPFYEKLGYTLFGTLEGFPPNHRQYFLTKSLQRHL